MIERLSLLVIITFGEMVMGLAQFFTAVNFSINSVLFFIIMASLFLFYFGIAIFHGATLANSRYNINDFKFPKCYYAIQILLFLSGLTLSLLLSDNHNAVILITSIMSICQTGAFVLYYLKKRPDSNVF